MARLFMKVPRVTISLALVLALSWSLAAQQAKPADAKPSPRTVELSVLVTNAEKKRVTNLRKEDVHVFEDAIEQTVQSITFDERPVDCGLLIDTSASMRALLDVTIEKAREIIINS